MALIKRIIMAFLLSLHADLHAIINLHARRGILDLAYQKNPLGNLKVAIFWDGGSTKLFL
jgi:hypothetical protein